MSKRKIQLSELENKYNNMTYQELYDFIISKINEGVLKPIKASKVNGRKPALFNAYWLIDKEEDYSDFLEEIKYKMHLLLDMSYYMKYPEKYKKDREYILLINEYLSGKQEYLLQEETINERSFEIFCKEKFLHNEKGLEIFKRMNFPKEKLNYYETSEPLSYYAHKKNAPQNFLIIENKDTFYSMRKHLIAGNDFILGLEVGTLIYGCGKGIMKTFADYVQAVEPYFADKNNQVYYFGDLDYEGILIYETLEERYRESVEVRVFTRAYEKMLEKATEIGFSRMPETKFGQKAREGNVFFRQFEYMTADKMKRLLDNRQYIPQEILNKMDY